LPNSAFEYAVQGVLAQAVKAAVDRVAVAKVKVKVKDKVAVDRVRVKVETLIRKLCDKRLVSERPRSWQSSSPVNKSD